MFPCTHIIGWIRPMGTWTLPMTESSIGCSIYQHATWWAQRLMPDAWYTMTWRMMQWLLATIFVILSPAELRVSKQSTTGQQSTSSAVSAPCRGCIGQGVSTSRSTRGYNRHLVDALHCHSVYIGVFASLCREIYRKVARWPSGEVATRNSNSQNW